MEKGITAWVPRHIFPYLRPGDRGEVLLVSTSGIYLRFGQRMVLLCDESWGVLPIGIGVADFERAVSLLRPMQGQPVTVTEQGLAFPSGGICLMPREWSGTTVAASPQIRYIRQAAEELAALRKERGISMLVEPLVLRKPPESSRKLNPYCAYGYYYLGNLMAALEGTDSAEIRSCVEKLLGLGPGLTPSADDCLLGMLYVFRMLPREAPKGAALLRESVGQLCDGCTHPISAAYLQAVIAGAPFERMDRVFAGLCGEEPLDIEKLTRIGSSSGGEMLLGMLIALKMCGYDAAQREELP